jgi:hypothetical protein
MNKPWPIDGDTARFEELTKPVCAAIRSAYRLSFRGYHDIKWSGLDIGDDEKATCFPPDEQLSELHLRYDSTEQGRPPLNVIVGVAVQLGIEQGRRMERKRTAEREQFAALLGRCAGDPRT